MTAASTGWLSQALATGLALLLVLVLAWLVLRTLRRLQPGLAGRARGVPQVLHSAGLGPRERLVLVQHRGREYLLGVSAGGVQLIDRWEAAPTASGSAEQPPPSPPSPQAPSQG